MDLIPCKAVGLETGVRTAGGKEDENARNYEGKVLFPYAALLNGPRKG